MKLYNLFKEVIIEESQKHIRLLTEGVDVDNVRSAIDDKYMVNIMYRPEEDNVLSKRYVAVYHLGKTTAGNDAIRVYQVSGGNRKTSDWKTFRLDRIEGWQPTKMRWYNPASDNDASIPDYKINQDKKFSVINKSVDPTKFGKPRSAIKPNDISSDLGSNGEPIDRSDMIKVPEPEPDADFIPEPTTEPETKKQPIKKPNVKVSTSMTPKNVKTEIPKPNEEEPEIEDNEENNENNL